MFSDLHEIQAILERPVESKAVQARWERKKLQQQQPGVKPTGKTPGRQDRFIPTRDAMNKDLQMHKVHNADAENRAPEEAQGPASCQLEFKHRLAESLFDGASLNSKVLAFKEKAPKPSEGHINQLRVLYTQNKQQSQVKKALRQISSTPERILDAPDLLDDYYLNLLDWGPHNVLAVGLGQCVYLWNAATGSINQLCEMKESEEVTSVKWMQDGSHLALGTSDNNVQLWSLERRAQVRNLRGHAARVGSLAWNYSVLSSGSRDATVFHHDVRVAQHHIATLRGHQQEICGLAWSPDGTQLASGGNDNVCAVWDANAVTPRYTFTEAAAAVKALAWCPWERGLLATGAGTADRHIRFYNTQQGAMINSIDTKSQVCSLVWSPHERELLSAHGFSQNQLTVWKYPSLVKIAELTGHTSRVLHTALSADGTTVCSAAADETLRFWRVWEPKLKKPVGPPVKMATTRSLDSINIR